MNLYVPLGSAPNIRRKRPYKIGGPADAEAAQRMYILPFLPCENRGERVWAWLPVLGHL
jgi:hypothetical protein